MRGSFAATMLAFFVIALSAGPGPINTDDNSWLEHRAPLDLITPQEENPLLAWSPQVEADLKASLH